MHGATFFVPDAFVTHRAYTLGVAGTQNQNWSRTNFWPGLLLSGRLNTLEALEMSIQNI